VNREDLTKRCQFGSDTVADEVVPIVADLSAPVGSGEPVTVLVGTREGVWAGHSVRAFPGEFHIQVTLLGKQTRPDAVADIFRHGATCIGLCGAAEEHLREARTLGVAAFHYGRGDLATVRSFGKPEFPEIAGLWSDEMDDLPLQTTVSLLRECEEACGREGRGMPLQMINLCRPRIPQALDFYELADAMCSAYGFHGGDLGEGFGRLSALPHREYRQGRRLFLPYFRNAELPLAVDQQTHTVLGLAEGFRRCMEPAEERWLTYGCVLQGAKGICHWNYGSSVYPPPNWFSKTQCVLRASLGGALEHAPHGYTVPAAAATALQRVWDEIGRINIELRAVGPLVAVSDVTTRARVVSATPVQGPTGEPAAEAAALVSGLDAIVLIVLSHNLKRDWRADSERGIESCTPVEVTVALEVPPWLAPQECFRVRWDGVAPVRPDAEPGRLVFRLEALEVSEVIVVTSRPDLMATMAATIVELRRRCELRRT
jgi:hypothetical protein